jgi:hypothetical protein
MDYRTTTKECREVWQLLQCSVCNPEMGVVNGSSLEVEDGRVPVCLGFCTKVYDQCLTSFFAGDEKFAIRGCHPTKDTICSALGDWDLDARGFCNLAGFRVVGQQIASINMDSDMDDSDRGKDEKEVVLEGVDYDDKCYNGELESDMKIRRRRRKEASDDTAKKMTEEEWLEWFTEEIENNAAFRWGIRVALLVILLAVPALVYRCSKLCPRMAGGKTSNKKFPGRGKTAGGAPKRF